MKGQPVEPGHRPAIERLPRTERRRTTVGVRAWLLAGAALMVLGPALALAAEPELSIDPSPSTLVEPAATESPTATPTADPTPSPTAEPTPDPTPGPTPRLVTVLNYRRSAIVRQYTSYWCVPAAVQTMWNLIRKDSNSTYLRQSTLYKQIRLHNRYHYSTSGNDVQGWAWALRRWTYKPYYARAYLSKTVAMGAIVEAIDRTGHPVGITVKSGTHAWVVLGYRTAVDPTDPTKRTLQGFYVTGPLGGYPDPYPYKYMTVAAFSKIYTRYHEWQRKVIWEGLYVVVND